MSPRIRLTGLHYMTSEDFSCKAINKILWKNT